MGSAQQLDKVVRLVTTGETLNCFVGDKELFQIELRCEPEGWTFLLIDGFYLEQELIEPGIAALEKALEKFKKHAGISKCGDALGLEDDDDELI